MAYPSKQLQKKKVVEKSTAFSLNALIYYFAIFSLMAACAAARRAIGTRNGEQDT